MTVSSAKLVNDFQPFTTFAKKLYIFRRVLNTPLSTACFLESFVNVSKLFFRSPPIKDRFQWRTLVFISVLTCYQTCSHLLWYHFQSPSEVHVTVAKNISVYFLVRKILPHQLPKLTLPFPGISESCIKIKINLNFYFHTSLWCLKRFYEDL